ncbi:MAG: hypothetical protein EA398_03525 [Deltaproteobacteria bacterium]|nr:MAG: hypothetical protein EA398_03525 [Deltaproteobacteria bacterium]
MPPISTEALTAFVLTVDRAAMAYLIPITLLFSTAATALLSRRRRWLEMVAIFVLSLVLFSMLLLLLFNGLLDRPIVRLEVIRA